MFKARLKIKSAIIAAVITAASFFALTFPADATDFPNELRDAGGIHHKPGNFTRIVTLSPNLTEICMKLGLQKHIVGASFYGDHPEMKHITKIDGWNVNYELILLLKPDLVLTTSSGNSPQSIERLRELKMHVFHTEQPDLEGIYNTISSIGRLTRSADRADSAILEMKTELAKIKAGLPKNAKRPRVIYLLWTSPIMATGGDTFLSEMIFTAGGKNIFAESGARIVKPSMEKIIELDPEIIFLPANTKKADLDKRWEMTTACKTGMVFNVNEDYVLRPGINTVKGIKELADSIRLQGQKRGAK